MRNFWTALIIFISVCGVGFSATLFKPGVYSLSGFNPDSSKENYRGSVIIRPFGPNYTLLWEIGNRQTMAGIGILQDSILSVAYYDLAGNGGGVVSFRLISDNCLEGKWALVGSSYQGVEKLTFKGDIP